MLNGYSLQLVMASHHAMVLGDLLNVTLKNVVYKDPYVTKVLSYQSMHDLCVRKIPSITFFRVSQKEMVNVPTDLRITLQRQRPCLEQGVATILYQYLETNCSQTCK